MGAGLLILVVLAAIVTITSGVWVAIALMAALRRPNGAKAPDESSTPAEPS